MSKNRRCVCSVLPKFRRQITSAFPIPPSGTKATTVRLQKLGNSFNEELGIPLETPLRRIMTEVLDFEFGVRKTDTSLGFIDSAGNYATS